MSWESKVLYGVIMASVSGSMIFVFWYILCRFVLARLGKIKEANFALKLSAIPFLIPFSLFAFLMQERFLHERYDGVLVSVTAGTNQYVRIGFLVVITVWTAGSVRLFYRYLISKKRLRGTFVFKKELDPEEREVFERVKTNMGYHGDVQAYHWPFSEVPMVVDSKMIFLPIKRMDGRDLEICLTHEMNHIRSRDMLWQKAANVICIVHWFNPLAYVWRKTVTLWGEIACDANSLLLLKWCSKSEYYETVIKFCNTGKASSECLCLSEGTKELLGRITHMKKFERKPANKILLAALTVCLSVMMVGTAFASERFVQKVDGDLLRGFDVAKEEVAQDVEADPELEEKIEYSDKAVEYIQDDGIATYAVADFSAELEPGIRYMYTKAYNVSKGDIIKIKMVASDDVSMINFGIKQPDGSYRYVTGIEIAAHEFEIKESGTYYVYVENMGKKNVNVDITITVK